nr:MAG TPA: hypothetical protein [Caudoviricetes sp.]
MNLSNQLKVVTSCSIARNKKYSYSLPQEGRE